MSAIEEIVAIPFKDYKHRDVGQKIERILIDAWDVDDFGTYDAYSILSNILLNLCAKAGIPKELCLEGLQDMMLLIYERTGNKKNEDNKDE